MVDSEGRPFLMNGDAAWSLIAQLKRPDVDRYLSDRKRRGFNTIIVNLVEHQFSSNPPANAYGDRPFYGPHAFSGMNERYFDHARWVIARARQMGFLVLLAPAYLGANGGGQGWYLEARAAGPQALHAYGDYLGKRFAGLDNIVWLLGGDYDPPDRTVVRAIVSGIESAAPNSLYAVHPSRDTATAHAWKSDRWLAFDTVYTYGNVYDAVLAGTRTDRKKPVLFIEGRYENEHGTGAETIRQEAYSAMLAGAAGQIYGNNPIWHFGAGGIEAVKTTWEKALGSPGARSMTHFRVFFESLDWWKITAAGARPMLRKTAGMVSATARDGSFAIAYLYDADAVTFLPSAGHRHVDVKWFDPATGHWRAFETGVGSTSTIRPPTPLNGAGDGDWVLVARYGD